MQRYSIKTWLLVLTGLISPLMFSHCGATGQDPTAIVVVVGVTTDNCIELTVSATQQFNMTIYTSGVAQSTDNADVTWTVATTETGCSDGTISNAAGTEGLYTAPASNPCDVVNVIATDDANDLTTGLATVLFDGTCGT